MGASAVDKKVIDIYSEIVDQAVIRLPGRHTLGSVIQGDTLFLLHADLMDILESHKHESDDELFYPFFLIAKNIEQRLTHYMQICKDSGIKLNFDVEFSVEHCADLLS